MVANKKSAKAQPKSKKLQIKDLEGHELSRIEVTDIKTAAPKVICLTVKSVSRE